MGWLKALHQESPFRLLLVDCNTVEGQFLAPHPDPRALAARIAEFAPDSLGGDDDEGAIGELAASIAETGTFQMDWE